MQWLRRLTGHWWNLSQPLDQSTSVSFVSVHSKKGMVLRHSASHVMAQAVKELSSQESNYLRAFDRYGILLRFYDYRENLQPQDLDAIAQRVGEIINRNQPFIRNDVPKGEAIKTFQDLGRHIRLNIWKIFRTGECRSTAREHSSTCARDPIFPPRGESKHLSC